MSDIYFIVKDREKVTDNEREQLDWLRYKEGKIWPAFLDFDGQVILAKQEDDVLGWGYMFNYPEEDVKTFYVYVRKDSRRSGLGSRIFNIAANENNNESFYVSKWDKRSKAFYKYLEV